MDRKWALSLILGLLLIWQGLSIWLTPELFPNPWQTFQTLFEILQDGEVLFHLGVTLTRVAWSFLGAMILGIGFGVLMGLFPQLDRLFNPLLIIGLNIPALITMVVLYVALGLNEWAAVIAVILNKIPVVTVILREGTRSLDAKLFQMAQVFRVSQKHIFWKIILPQLYPYILSAAKSGLSLIWKIVLVVEFLGRGSGMGFQIHAFFQNFEMASILAYTMLLIVVMLVIDYLLMKPLENYLFVWRTPYPLESQQKRNPAILRDPQ